MDNKKSNTSLIIIIILILCLIVASGYILYDKVLKPEQSKNQIEDNNEKESKEEVSVENLEITDQQVTSLYEKISHASGYYCGVDDYFTDKKVESKDISNNLAFNIALMSLYEKGLKISGANGDTNTGDDITKEQMDTEIDSIFGKDYVFTHALYSRCPYYAYDETAEKYIFGGSGCGGTCGPVKNIKKIVRAEKTAQNIYIYVRVVFVGKESSAKPVYYQDYNKTIKLDNLEKDNEGIAKDNDSNASKGSLYKLTFTSENQNMVFTSSELIK